ncbi:hypothetical protein DEO72_LG2g2818 [Vigna unguiculata]|uniref:Uncharacterized protein n=1 Tax=Vigna unguiculata TaxID=3917 RepID=A0A4D6L1W5_VIGUN|nr:hypothetical protein DEO72_LG2g2818 [Vigna unguiculata]
MSRTSQNEKIMLSEKHDEGKFGPDYLGTMEDLEHVESSFNIYDVSIAMPQSSRDHECINQYVKVILQCLLNQRNQAWVDQTKRGM